MRKLLIVIPLLILVLIAIDRASVLLAEREIGTRVQSAYDLPARPGVSVHGFPFLTQVASGHYQEIDVSIKAAKADGVQLRNIQARFTGVHAPLSLLFGQNSAQVTASQATGTAVIPYSQVERRLPGGVTLSADGNSLRVTGKTPLGTIDGTARLSVTKSGISVSPEHVTVNGVSAGSLASRFTFAIPVGALPLRLTVTSVHAGPDGLVVAAAGHDVAFVRG
jgi:carbon monoxide dehydrogenase subunit G